jgi:hypothetical protein
MNMKNSKSKTSKSESDKLSSPKEKFVANLLSSMPDLKDHYLYHYSPHTSHERPWDTRTDFNADCAFGSEWETGGISGGSCWDSSDPQPYTTDNRGDLKVFQNVVLHVVPNISFVDYLELEKSVVDEVKEREEREYYGNSTNYSAFVFTLSKLFDKLEQMNLAPNWARST